MDRDQFDRLSRLVAAAGTRRDALRLLVASAVAGAAGGAATASARKQRGKDRKRERVRGEADLICTNICVNCGSKPIKPGANLAKCDFSNQSFIDGLNLGSANLTNACFARAELRGAQFNSASAGGVCFQFADLRNASFRGANVAKAVFCGANLKGADFRGSNITQAQLGCAVVGCNTILPNGKTAGCEAGYTCCDGACINTRTDSQNCGACGNTCPRCTTCVDGSCRNVPDNTIACDGSALNVNGDTVCTARPNVGICVRGVCDCASAIPSGEGTCLCNPLQTLVCVNEDACCRIQQVCRTGNEGTSQAQCVACQATAEG
ncbi:MAG: pentapeptide repeat-containing protein [Thermomicrobiales bacterium]